MKLFKIKNIILILVIFFVVLLNAEVEVSIIDPSYQLIHNEDVTLSVNLSDLVQAMRAFEINVTYDTNFFSSELSDIQEGDFLSDSGDETQWYVTGVDGNYTVTCSILGVTSGNMGSGTLFTLLLTNLNNDTSRTDVTLPEIILKDILNNEIAVDMIGSCQISIYSNPSVVINNPSYQLVYNEDVTISVDVNGIEPTMAMMAFEIDISYDTNYLHAGLTDFTEGDFLSNSGDETQWYVTGVDGNYTVTCSILGATSGCIGSGSLFTIFLTNLNNDTPRTDVTMPEIILKDLLNNEIAAYVIGSCQISIDTNPAFVDFTLLLEGPYAGSSTMNHSLIDKGYIPTISPYDSEDLGSLPDVSPNFIVDWVYLQLRLSPNGSTVNSTNAFLLENGSIVDVDGESSFPFYHTTGIEYYIVIQHRNHLDIMTATSNTFGDNIVEATEIDLTNADNVYGTNGVKQLETGISGLYCGDADQDGQIFPNDRNDYWRIQTGQSGYKEADFDLDGMVLPNDLNELWRINSGLSSQVP